MGKLIYLIFVIIYKNIYDLCGLKELNYCELANLKAKQKFLDERKKINHPALDIINQFNKKLIILKKILED